MELAGANIDSAFVTAVSIGRRSGDWSEQ